MFILPIIQLIFLISGTLFLLYISRKSLVNRKAHGFYRFFVFEFTLILVLLNIPFWFNDPFSVQQIISWVLLITSIYLVYQSYSFLKKIGGGGKRETGANYKFENTANLVKTGVYKYIRHPMYSSLLFLSAGAYLKDISVYSVILTLLTVLFLILTAKTEEKENINYFGAAYSEYMKETKRFVPFIL